MIAAATAAADDDEDDSDAHDRAVARMMMKDQELAAYDDTTLHDGASIWDMRSSPDAIQL